MKGAAPLTTREYPPRIRAEGHHTIPGKVDQSNREKEEERHRETLKFGGLSPASEPHKPSTDDGTNKDG